MMRKEKVDKSIYLLKKIHIDEEILIVDVEDMMHGFIQMYRPSPHGEACPNEFIQAGIRG